MKRRDKLLWAFGAVLLIVLIVWGIFETAGSDSYNYAGYVTEIAQNEKNQTVITTVSGGRTSKFVLKWSSRKRFEKDKREIAVGDSVMISTTHFSNINIKKISVDDGYFTEGKLVYVNEADTPFLLAVEPSQDVRYLVALTCHFGQIEGKTGGSVRIYHAYPIREQPVSVLEEAWTVISENSELTIEEIAFIEAKGYTVKE